jgi:RimJ/RimL family protein N-acetyltransferase
MLPSTEPIETDRLLLLPWTDEYDDLFAALCADERAMEFISGGRPLPREHVDEINRRANAMWSEHGFGPWAAVERWTGHWIGRVGLNLLADWPGPDKWEVGYELVPSSWGSGYATEGARTALAFAWEQTPLKRVISVTVPDHAASRRVMEKAGLTFQEEIQWRGTNVVWYAIDRPQP